MWDMRQSIPTQTIETQSHIKAADMAINGMALSPWDAHSLLTAHADHNVRLWDLRRFDSPIHTFESHQDAVDSVRWSPHEEVKFMSFSADRRVMVWDLSQIGAEQDPEEAEDGPPELFFTHGGHRARVWDCSWNRHDPSTLASVAEDNSLHVWQISSSLLEDSDDELDEVEVE